MNSQKTIDMSPEAIDRRLQMWNQLHKWGMSLKKTIKIDGIEKTN
jgi:hypothetical protein